ncbi:TonB-dependent receptor [Novosphingobium panipatense]|uniref:Iron complex outermembrane recepter protein n=1 Tax=Novosphingobium panipatense TaxID=428991 RepID=A0ABY1Q9T3_9SPHN|nr:TonB-dependent receptor [Novosphingobium panipatense]SMP61820.1 iron complex outermembrane recepter protein [Novosphingobium panipatense]
MPKARFFAISSSVLALTGGFGAAPTMAQDAAPAAETAAQAGDIIVTARRREERLVDVPISVSTFSGAQLEKSGALDITDIANVSPNVTLEPSRGTNSTLSAFIRGVGQQDPVSGFEQGVGIYLDDVYLNRPQAAVLDIYDVERIEVLRGPQGTLYGRNTIGGAVKYVTRQLPQDFAFRIRGTYGSYDQADLVATASAPVSELIRVGGSVARLSRGGFGKNLTTGEDNYNKDIWAGRASVDIGGYGEPVLIRISGDYTKDKSNARGGHRLIPGYVSGAPVLSDVYDTRGGLNDPRQEVEAYGFAINASADLTDQLTFRSISSWRKDDSASPIDFDALPAVDVDVPAYYRNEQISQEFQLLYDDGGMVQGLIGAYYLNANADTQFDTRLFTALNGLTAFTQANVDTETFAVFGDFTVDFSERLSLSVGGRYTWDERKAEILRQNYLGGGSPVFGGAGLALGAPSTNFSGKATFKKFTPRASISFKPTPDHNIYASFSQGFKGGGFDPRGVGVNAPSATPGAPTSAEIADYLSFEPETVDSYEIGYKGNLFDGALYLAAAGFYMNYKDVQIPGSAGCTVGGIPTFCGIITNAGKARFKGVELEANARLAQDLMTGGDRLSLSGALGYIDAEYREYIANIPIDPAVPSITQPTDVAEYRKVQNTPKWTVSGTLAYSTPIGEGDLDLSATYAYRSKTYQFEIPNPYLDQKGFGLFDASLVYTAPEGRWSLGVHGKNLFDKRYKTSGYTFLAADPRTGELATRPNGQFVPTLGTEGILTAYYGNPRQVFATAALAF